MDTFAVCLIVIGLLVEVVCIVQGYRAGADLRKALDSRSYFEDPTSAEAVAEEITIGNEIRKLRIKTSNWVFIGKCGLGLAAAGIAVGVLVRLL